MKIFGLLSSKNYATMGTWHNDFSSLYIAMHLSNLFLKRPVKSQDFYNFECKLKILHCTEILYVYFLAQQNCDQVPVEHHFPLWPLQTG